METIQAGAIADFFDKIFNSFLKSMEGLFTSEGETTMKEEKGKIVAETKEFPESPILDDKGKPLPENAAVFNLALTLQWPKDKVLTREDARKIAESIAKGDQVWKDAESIRLTMDFMKKNKVDKQNITVQQVDAEIAKYKEKFNIIATATKRMRYVIFLFTEGKPEAKPEGENNGENASASNRLKVTLKKVVGETETAINLTNITANYDILNAMDDLDAVVSDDAFVDQLPENEEVSYEITSDNTDYDVNPCDSFNCEDIIQQLIYTTLHTSLEMRMLSMVLPRDNYGVPTTPCYSDMLYTLDAILPILADALIDIGGSHVAGFEFMTDNIEFSNSDIALAAADSLERYLGCMEVVYDCVSRGIQFKLDQHISHIEDTIRSLRRN